MEEHSIAKLIPPALLKEGPTPGALHELLENIDREASQIRDSLYHGFASQLASGTADPKVLSAMASLADIPGSSDVDQWLASCAKQYMETQQHLEALQAELKAAEAAADLQASLREFNGFLENGQFNDAAYHLAALRKILDDSQASSTGTSAQRGSELAQLQQACADCDKKLQEALTASLADAFDTSSAGSGVITITCSLPSGGDVGDLWAACEVAQLAEQQLKGVADVLLQSVLPGVLHGTGSLDAHILPGGDSAQLRWFASPPPAGTTDAVEQQCSQLLTVLAEALFRQRPGTLAAFGGVFWGRFVEAYQAAFLQQVSGSNLAVLQARQQAAGEMEKLAVSIGLAEPGSDLAICLTRAIQESYHVVQEGFLAAARELLLAHDPAGPPTTVGQPLPLDAAFYQRYKQGKVKAWEVLDPPSGWDVSGPMLATGYYPVSHTVLQLVIMMDDALAHACHQGGTSAAQAVVSAVSKMAALFPRLLPAPAAADAPALALQRHNDLQYLSRHMLVLPFLFGGELRELLGAPLWFGDDALRLRADARAAFHETLAVQNSAVRESLVPLLELSASLGAGKAPPPKEAEAAAAAAQQAALYTLRRAGRLLWSNLAPAAALEASQQLLEPMANLLVADVLGKRDIGEAEAAELVRMYRPLLDAALPELLADAELSSQVAAGQADLDLRELVGAALQQRCHSLRKLGAVLRLLEVRLADIVDAWEAGALKAAGLSLPEVGRLVVALFEDTDYRAQCLQRMEAAEGL